MAELIKNTGKKIIAFYLPQYHRIKENDTWWGDGFTDWTNVKKAVPLFEGHYQPKIPLNKFYYDLSDDNVLKGHAELAKKYGIYGFCYYHYWFKDGKKLLEKPIERMLKNKRVNIPFCLCWANENWTRNWDGGDFEVIARQKYGSKKEWRRHFLYLLKYFKDTRYITYCGKPLIIIYKPEQIVLFEEMASYWKKLAVLYGFPGLIIMRQYPGPMLKRLDYSIDFQPLKTMADMDKPRKKIGLSLSEKIRRIVKKILVYSGNEDCVQKIMVDMSRKCKMSDELRIIFYDDAWKYILRNRNHNRLICKGAFTGWDNTSRRKNGIVFVGSTPEKFEKYMSDLLKEDSAMNCIFINAWNEWAEGAYLEPDNKYGYGYLEALLNSIKKFKDV